MRCCSSGYDFGYYGSYFSLATLREKAKTTNDGTTALGLVKVAEGLNFETRAFKADMSLFDLEEVSYPFIAHILKDGKLLHYYVVTGQDKHTIHIADPDPQVKMTKISRERFEQEWTGITISWLLVRPISLVRKRKWAFRFHSLID